MKLQLDCLGRQSFVFLYIISLTIKINVVSLQKNYDFLAYWSNIGPIANILFTYLKYKSIRHTNHLII